MPRPPKSQKVGDLPGSSVEEIENEPDWGAGHDHRIGVVNRHGRMAGLTHEGDHAESTEDEQKAEEAMQKYKKLRQEHESGQLLNWQDIMKAQTDFSRNHKSRYPPSWRFVVETTEDFVRNQQDWPANIKAKEKKKEQEKQKKQDNQDGDKQSGHGKQDGEEKAQSTNEDKQNDDKQQDSKQQNDKSQGDKYDSDKQQTEKQQDGKPSAHEKKDDRKSDGPDQDHQAKTEQSSDKDTKADQKENSSTNAKDDKDDTGNDEKKENIEQDVLDLQPNKAEDDRESRKASSTDKDKHDQVKSSDETSPDRGSATSQSEQNSSSEDTEGSEDNEDEDEWRHNRGHDKSDKHHPAYGFDQSRADADKEYTKLREKYTPQEIALLRTLQHEKNYIAHLEQNDGTMVSPVQIKDPKHRLIGVDKQDTMTPDNWIPRSTNLIRHTGQHPLNAEPRFTALYDAGLVTPNELHYVRNHGAVPRLFWETHSLEIDGKLKLSMDELADNFEPINVAMVMACDGTRRGELNMIKKSKGFTWGPAPVSNAYWKGARLCDVLNKAGYDHDSSKPKRRLYVHFEGADNLSEGKYATSIAFDHAINPQNDVILAYEMNNTPLPADHGFPLRVVIPGFVGGRCVKWLSKIWVSDKENDSYYHIWDNRVVPSFITEKDGQFAQTMFGHPDTACNEQNLNSTIARPAQDERLDPAKVLSKPTYRVEGIAYTGGGHMVQRVEISLDEGKTWVYAVRKFPHRPIRHGNRYWGWCFWHVDIDSMHFIRAPSIVVRAWDVFKNTQPAEPSWNVMGMMNNCWYRIKPRIDKDSKHLVYQHPVDIEGDGGWMKPSTENQLAAAKQNSNVPGKQFTRQEIEKHNKKDDCWLVINDNVYDVTSVLDWHPGGPATIMTNAGKVSAEVTSSFESIHDEYAHKKLQECAIGKVTDKVAKFMQEQAKKAAADAAKSDPSKSKIVLEAKRWSPVTLTQRDQLSKDTFRFTFSYKEKGRAESLGLGTCQHIEFGIHMADKMLVRQYTPTRPILESEDDGTFELVVKTYFPDDNQPGGAFSNMLYMLPIGEQVSVSGPSGEIEYKGQGKFIIQDEEVKFDKVNLILGGSGITPGYELLARVLREKGDKTQIRVVDANKSEGDILLKEEMEEFEKEHGEQFKVTHVLSHPSDEWKGEKGHVNADIIKAACFPPGEGVGSFLCGPPTMIQKAAVPALQDWGFKDEKDLFGF